MRVGFIGLGRMGSAMAADLLRAGHEVTVYNRTPSKAETLAAEGAKVATSIADACHGEVVFTMLANDEAVEGVVFGDGGILASLPKGAIHISSSTISVALSERLATAHAEAEQRYVAATVLGRPEAAAAGKLIVIAAGASDAVAEVTPLLDAIGQSTTVFGDTPSVANLVKLAANLMTASVIESLGEAIALTSRAKIDKRRFLEFLTSTNFNAPVYKTFGELVIADKPAPAGFAAPLAFKDIGLALKAGEELRVPMPFASVLHDRFVELLANGGDKMDWSAIGRLPLGDPGRLGSDRAGRAGTDPRSATMDTQTIAEPATTAAAANRPRVETVNPASGEPGRSYPEHTPNEAHAAAAAAHVAFLDWRRASFADRAALMREAGAVLRRRSDEFAALMTEEMGKTLSDGRAEIEKCASQCDWFADHAQKYLAPEPVDIGGPEAFVTFNPLGVVLAVMPWNFPFWQVFRFAAPALMAGNAAILKHASNVPGCALAIEGVFHEAGFARDLFRTLLLPSSEVKALIEDDHIAAVTLTGSVAAGKSVATAAGGVLKKCVLELGGSDAYVVLEDADIAAAARVCAAARMVNGGQSCIAGKRFVVVREVLAEFEGAMVEAMRGYVMGDPRDESTKFGPLQSVHARGDVHAQVLASVANGARLLLGGEVPDRPGAWYPATVLADVSPGQPAYDEEVFGPVAAIIAAEDEADAIRIANASEFGLGSGVLTGDIDRGRRIAAEELEAGMSFVNENVRSDPRMPFGGVKHSGYGRECGAFGIREFTNIKSVHVKPPA